MSVAEQCKKRGNEAFAKGKLEAAIEAYSEALCLEPGEPVYYTNRAMCHRKKEAWEAVVADCSTALELDDASIKGHYLLGVALDALCDHEDATLHLHRALELCKDKTVSYKEDIQRAMLLARKRQWSAGAGVSQAQLGMTERLVTRLVAEHFDAERARLQGGGGGGGGSSSSFGSSGELDFEAKSIAACVGEALDELRSRRGHVGKVPDPYCCQITMEIMLDPVTTPDGITYERSALTEHLSKVGKFDPLTRRALEPHQLVSNLALKEAINAYLRDHPWAYEGV